MIYNPNTARREAFRLARITADEAETRVMLYLMERKLARDFQEDIKRYNLAHRPREAPYDR